MLGTRHGYYSTDATEQWKIDSTIDAASDLYTSMYKFAFEADAEKKKVAAEAFFTTTFPQFCEIIEKRLNANSSQKFIVNDRITIADFSLGAFAYSTIFNEGNAG